ncbi:hypothetical protein MKW92_009150 [Papaver armeniacum]|nr:hypothetical protein MKW92_009150 [Papaver armeniacum]
MGSELKTLTQIDGETNQLQKRQKIEPNPETLVSHNEYQSQNLPIQNSDHVYSQSSRYVGFHGQDHNTNAIEIAAQDAVLREQELATQQIIHTQREARGGGDDAVEADRDILSGRYDSTAIKGHLLRMTTDHRAEIASKRGNSGLHGKGNNEIGNGYGTPGGSAYYGASRPSTTTSRERLESKDSTKELPEYLKQRLKARGILKWTQEKGKLDIQPNQATAVTRLPPGWYWETQWEVPSENFGSGQPPYLPPQQDWIETLDETSGCKYYFNTKTHVSQWEVPESLKKVPLHSSFMQIKCMGCGGWGLGLVQAWGYCNHCTRVLNLPLSAALPNYNSQHPFSNTANNREDSNKIVSNNRPSSKPPVGKGIKSFNKKRTQTEDDELDPMDPRVLCFNNDHIHLLVLFCMKNAEVAAQTKETWFPICSYIQEGDGSDGLGDAD